MSRHRCHYTSIPPVKLVDRRLPSFEDMKHDYRACNEPQEWATDHKAPSRGRYKECNGVRVYEGGFIEVTSYVYRNPEARQALARKYGLQILLPKECVGIKFFSPDGVPVSRNAVNNASLLLDKQTMRAYAFDIAWNDQTCSRIPFAEARGLSFATPGTVPVSHSTIFADVPDNKRVKEVMRENKEFFKACAVTAQVMHEASVPIGTGQAVVEWLRARLRGDEPDLLTPGPNEMADIGRRILGAYDLGLQALLTELSTTSQRFPYLKMVVVGGGNG